MQTAPTSYKPLISLVDESFDSTSSENYHLSIELSAVNLSYAILDSVKNKYLLLQVYSFQKTLSDEQLASELKYMVQGDTLLRLKFKSTSLSIFTSKFTFVPCALFDTHLTNKYLEFNTSLSESEVILSETIRNFDTQCVYSVNKALLNSLQELFPTAHILHTFSSILSVISSSFKHVSGKNVIVHLQQTHFEVIVLEDKKLIFANLFSYQTSEDFLYYLLFVFEQLKLNPENIELLLLGEVEKNSAIYSILNKYVRHVKLGVRTDLFEYSYLFDTLPSHFYYNLFSQAICV